MVEVDYKKQGKTNRLRGQIFETRVREDLEAKGWIVTKWMNTVDFERDKVAPSKRKYNPFTKALSIGTGFPDLLCFKKNGNLFEVVKVKICKSKCPASCILSRLNSYNILLFVWNFTIFESNS